MGKIYFSTYFNEKIYKLSAILRICLKILIKSMNFSLSRFSLVDFTSILLAFYKASTVPGIRKLIEAPLKAFSNT